MTTKEQILACAAQMMDDAYSACGAYDPEECDLTRSDYAAAKKVILKALREIPAVRIRAIADMFSTQLQYDYAPDKDGVRPPEALHPRARK